VRPVAAFCPRPRAVSGGPSAGWSCAVSTGLLGGEDSMPPKEGTREISDQNRIPAQEKGPARSTIKGPGRQTKRPRDRKSPPDTLTPFVFFWGHSTGRMPGACQKGKEKPVRSTTVGRRPRDGKRPSNEAFTQTNLGGNKGAGKKSLPASRGEREENGRNHCDPVPKSSLLKREEGGTLTGKGGSSQDGQSWEQRIEILELQTPSGRIQKNG